MPSDEELDNIYLDCYSDENLIREKTHMGSSAKSIAGHAEFISNICKANWKILDFGAGKGELLLFLKNKGFNGDGIEFSQGAIDYAQKYNGIKLYKNINNIYGNIEEKFDFVSMIEVIEHISTPWHLLTQIEKCLKPGGMLYISTPNTGGIQARIFKQNWREAVKPFHLTFFNYKAISLMLKNVGFKKVREIRFSPLTTESISRIVSHRILQSTGLYGGLRVLAEK